MTRIIFYGIHIYRPRQDAFISWLNQEILSAILYFRPRNHPQEFSFYIQDPLPILYESYFQDFEGGILRESLYLLLGESSVWNDCTQIWLSKLESRAGHVLLWLHLVGRLDARLRIESSYSLTALPRLAFPIRSERLHIIQECVVLPI